VGLKRVDIEFPKRGFRLRTVRARIAVLRHSRYKSARDRGTFSDFRLFTRRRFVFRRGDTKRQTLLSGRCLIYIDRPNVRGNDRPDRARPDARTSRYATKIPGLCVSARVVSLRDPFIIVRRRLTSDRLDRSSYYSTIVHTRSDLSREPDAYLGDVRTRRVKIVSLEIARVPRNKSQPTRLHESSRFVHDRDRHLTNPSESTAHLSTMLRRRAARSYIKTLPRIS